MLSRRSFLLTTTAIALSQSLGGCQSNGKRLIVQLLEDSIPPQLLREFKQEINPEAGIKLLPTAQLQELWDLLQRWQQPEEKEKTASWLPVRSRQTPADLATLGDYWLTEAIQSNLITPLNLDSLTAWDNLPPRWQTLVRRNGEGELDPDGEIWGAPYRWGTLLIAYRQDLLKDLDLTPTDWDVLWREEVQGRISTVEHPRAIIGLGLKKLGYSLNTTELAAVADLEAELKALNEQIRFYSSNAYLEPLILGDTWVAVGWSNEIIPLIKRNPNIKAVVPQSGTALWSDLWVKPSQAEGVSTVADDWINFCWQPRPASLISLFTPGASPVTLSQDLASLPEDLQNNPLIRVDEGTLADSEFIEPLAEEVEEEYKQLWRESRGGR
jgi:putative spermidine/putrescine transport system substrate-binding protein